MHDDNLVGVAEIADLLSVSRQRVHAIIQSYKDFPAPTAELAAGRIWKLKDVKEWIKAHPVRAGGRPKGRGSR